MKSMIDLASLAHDLRAIGLRRGDIVLVHSSYRSLGIDHPETLIQALIQAHRRPGTLLLPALSYRQTPPTVHNTLTTPSCVGFLRNISARAPARSAASTQLTRSVRSARASANCLAIMATTRRPVGRTRRSISCCTAAGRSYGEDDRGHAEEHLVRRIAAADAERRLAPRAERGGDAGEIRSDEEQRREVDGVRKAHRRAAAGQRQPHLEGGADRRHQQQAEEPGHRRHRRRRRRAERQAERGRGHRAGGQPAQAHRQRRPGRAVVTHRRARRDLVPDRTRRSCDRAWRG